MPPLRTFLPVKPVKTERTHEENQERAYIAASRRSDRSLEARVESARRASEIHKRRTGRSLRVTEQDVINEEMYEEEDDDLPSQYRRLTAHLQTGSADFNRRLAAYLTNHVAMRSALDSAVEASYAQQFPNAPQFAHNLPETFPSPFQPHRTAQSPSGPRSPVSPHPYRQAPYPTARADGNRQNSHRRSASISTERDAGIQATPSDHPMNMNQSLAMRRLSMPARQQSSSDGKTEALSTPSLTSSKNSDEQDEIALQQMQCFNPSRFSPFTTTLPLETQQLVGPALDPNDPFTSSLMSGSGFPNYPSYGNTFYNYMAKDIKGAHRDGMNSTLAPALDSSQKTATQENVADVAPQFGLSNDFSMDFNDLQDGGFTMSNSAPGSGNVTPGSDGAWDALINETSWAENAT